MIQTAQLVQLASDSGQDRVLVRHFDSRVVLAVADGVGGRSGGAEAADMAVAEIAKQAHILRSQADCERVLRGLDAAIRDDATAGETTCVIAVVTPSHITGASVGDSGAWLIISAGVDDLTQGQVRKPFLGIGVAAVAGFSRSTFEGTLVLASDGLLKYTSRETIAEASRELNLDEAAKKLIALVRYPSGALPDDVAVVLCRRSS